MQITKLEAFVLDSMADDCENLEQIFKSIAFDFSSELYEENSNSFYLKPNKEFSYSLDKIIEAIIKFNDEGFIRICNPLDINDKIPNSFIWTCWFELTNNGRLLLNENEHYFNSPTSPRMQ